VRAVYGVRVTGGHVGIVTESLKQTSRLRLHYTTAKYNVSLSLP
jgi:hypothetical protein